MSITGGTYRAEVFAPKENERHIELRRIAATKLQNFTCHVAGHGSEYAFIGDVKIRFADHETTSKFHEGPDYNIVKGHLTTEQITEIERGIEYPRIARKLAFAKHVGLTVPKLKKLLTTDCYEDVCLDPMNYPNTMTQFVVVKKAFAVLKAAGITSRIPVAQERWTAEDYAGPGW